uniref:Uncharacterized protein n=1 Tax=Rhizophora mucronata TaxID=61149 RepID=A0A2P2N452_RHIMU
MGHKILRPQLPHTYTIFKTPPNYSDNLRKEPENPKINLNNYEN